MPIPFKQSDPRWATTKLQLTEATVVDYGCNITSHAIGRSRLYPDEAEKYTPEWFAEHMMFTKNGEVIHQQKYPGYRMILRQWIWRDMLKLFWYIRSKKRFAVIAVSNNRHFVFAYYIGFKGIYIIDPFDGQTKLLKEHYTPCGYALYEKN